MASTERRSLNQQTLFLLDSAKGPEERKQRLKAEADRQTGAWRHLSGRWQSKESVQEKIARIYATRTEGRRSTLIDAFGTTSIQPRLLTLT
jgi:hypothetical protein